MQGIIVELHRRDARNDDGLKSLAIVTDNCSCAAGARYDVKWHYRPALVAAAFDLAISTSLGLEAIAIDQAHRRGHLLQRTGLVIGCEIRNNRPITI